MTNQKDKLPEATAGDAVHVLAKAGLSAIPIVGGPAAELFAYVIVPPLTKRREAWLKSLADGLKEMEKKVSGFSMESLSTNDLFVNMLMEASTIAVRNHVKEKVDALRNAVLNSAIQSPDEYFQGVLLQFLSIATPWHFNILSFYSSPETYLREAGLKLETGDFLSRFVGQIFPELKGQDVFRLQIERDLLHYGLILPETAWYSERATNTGDRVLKQISSPVGV